jgi:hypothetical protein
MNDKTMPTKIHVASQYADTGYGEWAEHIVSPRQFCEYYGHAEYTRTDLVEALKEITEAVAHIGVNFGYGEYELEPKFIGMAREALTALREDGS